MVDLVRDILKAIVDHPDAVEVKEVEGERASIIEIKVHEEDVGKVIGREGRIINSLRQIVRAAAGKDNKRITIELLS
ncbi:KH domain-containing protein [bacterium]|nr:KH domain-containing protein [bacterium]